jgi:hypothetical protein
LEESTKQGVGTLQSVLHSQHNTNNENNNNNNNTNTTSDLLLLESLAQSVERASQTQIRRGALETTYERQLLAERLRRRLANAGAVTRLDLQSNDALWPNIVKDVAAPTAVATASVPTAQTSTTTTDPTMTPNTFHGTTIS